MKIYTEMPLKEFEFWGAAENFVKYIADEEFDWIEDILTSVDTRCQYFDKTYINDLFSFNKDYIAYILGYRSAEEMIKDKDKLSYT